MISDEMREVLSVYVDGELRDKDVARVEQMAKCDTEMSKEIQAYKLLRKKLRSWDKSEQDEGPSPLVREQAIRRARAYLRSRAQQRKGALLHLFLRPIALAAALLIAVALGIVVASGAETPQPGFVASNGSVALTPLADDEERTLPGALAAPDRATPVLLQERPGVSLIEDNGDRLMYEGRAYSREALNRKLKWAMEDALWALQKARLPGSASKSVPTVNIPVKVLLRDFSPAEAPAGSFVTMKHDGPLNLKGLRAALGTEKVHDHVIDPGLCWVSNQHGAHPILFLQGEVLVAGDGSKRTRIVASDFWVNGGVEPFMPIIWADDVAAPKHNPPRLKLQSEILGSDIRRELVGAAGRDVDLVKMLQKRLPGYFKSKLDAAKVRALRRQLSDADVTGFAILEGDRVRGVELFGTHALLESFAERLIRGYVRQGGASLKIKPLSGDRKAVAFDAVRKHMARLPEISLRSQEQRTKRDGYSGLMENITLRGAGGKVLGHGLVQDDSLIHLTLFGE
jgi:hypothetical protein